MDAGRLNGISGAVVDSALRIHQEVGPGLLESVYEVLLSHELRERGHAVVRQQAVAIESRGLRFEEGYRLDLLVDDAVVVEVKSVESLKPVHSKQLITYLRLANKPLGLLLNFNVCLMKDGIVRIANRAPD